MSVIVFGIAMHSCQASLAVVAEVIAIEHAGITAVHTADVPAEEAGSIRELFIRAGEDVAEGSPLLQLDDGDAQLELRRAEIQCEHARQLAKSDVAVRLAEVATSLARMDLTRAEESVQRYPKSVSPAQLDRLRTMVQKATLESEQVAFDLRQHGFALQLAERQLALAQRRVARRTIVAPRNGQVASLTVRQGEWVEPGETVVRLVDLSLLRAEGFVAARDVAPSLLGREAALVVQLEETQPIELLGHVTFVGVEVNRVDGKVQVWAEFANPNRRVLPGMSGALRIDLRPRAQP